MFGKDRMSPNAGAKIERLTEVKKKIQELESANVSVPVTLTKERDKLETDLRAMNPTKGTKPKKMGGGKVKKYMGGGKVYINQNKRYAHGGKVSGRKATYKY